MSQGKKVSKKTESLISFGLIVVLILIAAAILYARKDFSLTEIGFIHQEVDADKGDTKGFQAYLDENFTLAGQPEVYNSQSLYEKINGKAPFYIEAGFEKLTTYRVIHKNDSSLWAEIYLYDMGNSLNAFAVYSAQKRENSQSLDIQGYGYKTSNSIFFISGNYYVEVVGSNPSEQLIIGLENIAANFEKANLQDAEFDIAQLFPEQGLKKDSIVLYKADAFGFSQFKDVFVANFDIDGESITAFMIKKDTPESAQQLLEAYKKYLVSSGFEEKTGNENINVFDYDGFYELIFTAGSYFGGVHEAFDNQKAQELAEKLYDHAIKLD